MTVKEAYNILLTHDGKGKEAKSRALDFLLMLTKIEVFSEVSQYYGQGAFYANSEQDGRESVYWSKRADSLKEILEKY